MASASILYPLKTPANQKASGVFREYKMRVIIVGTPPFCRGGEVEPPTKFSKRGSLTGPQILEGVAGKEGVTFFRGVAIFT